MTTISNRLLQDWLHATKARGYDLKALLRTSGIPWRSYEDPRSHISGEQLTRLNREIRRLLDDQFLGYGQEALSPALLDRVLIKILGRARNLKEMLLEWENFYNLVQGTGSIVSGAHEDVFCYRFQFKASQRPGAYVWFLESTMLKLRLFSWMIGKQIKLKSIGFSEPASANAGQYSSLLSTSTFFGQPQNFFAIDQEHLNSPVIRTIEECLHYNEYLPSDFFAIPGDDRRFAGRVERAMRTLLKTELRLPKIDCVAEELSISVRGLRRRLVCEGESFQKLKDKIRRDLAKRRLADSGDPIAHIAAELGFSGAMAFSRAFRAWTKRTPREYRNYHTAVRKQDQ